jgi:hypothetical protein
LEPGATDAARPSWVSFGPFVALFVTATGAISVACVPSGNAEPRDAGPPAVVPVTHHTNPQPVQADMLTAPFEDDFEHGVPARIFVANEGGGPTPPGPATAQLEPGADWMMTAPGIWHIENGRLCGEHAHNHGIWLKHALPVNARIEFDAVSQSTDGDLKAEFWGDGRSYATTLSYTNATSYLTIFGGWHNKYHVLARINEHGNDRKEITVVDLNSDDVRERPVITGQVYRFKVERSDGRTVRWWIDGNEMLTYGDTSPLSGVGHDHFGFNDWDVKVCFDNVHVVPLP